MICAGPTWCIWVSLERRGSCLSFASSRYVLYLKSTIVVRFIYRHSVLSYHRCKYVTVAYFSMGLAIRI
ncbi:hypothetical protein PEX2_040480 [Penicillium expansum]|uniref:Uncharacterized protein n=1 Tax=Penicillium expansum TaxID=27334 RepID=A0A0A2JR27_PENEN|nr:hypothetical protein PEX2_040480 [Penicillium expansum]KGO45812.1 hypothetical protein PEXP_019350 [Penicillium expansum]KGO57897.1 hypothetical protein PEX2_040480 [Penicillium expansum]